MRNIVTINRHKIHCFCFVCILWFFISILSFSQSNQNITILCATRNNIEYQKNKHCDDVSHVDVSIEYTHKSSSFSL